MKNSICLKTNNNVVDDFDRLDQVFWRGICGVNRIITLSGKIVDDF